MTVKTHVADTTSADRESLAFWLGGEPGRQDQEAPSAETTPKGFPAAGRHWKAPGPSPASAGPAALLAYVHGASWVWDSPSKGASKATDYVACDSVQSEEPPPCPGRTLPLRQPGEPLITFFIHKNSTTTPTSGVAVRVLGSSGRESRNVGYSTTQ